MGIIHAALALVEAVPLLMTTLIHHDQQAKRADAKEERLWNNLTWDLGIAFIAISAIGGLIVFVFLKAFLSQKRLRVPATGSTA
jgi:hypothetical protein